MQTQRITVPSLFTLEVSACVCLLAFDAYSQSVRENNAPSLASASQGASNRYDYEGFHATLNKRPLAEFVTQIKKSLGRGDLDLNSSASLIIEADRAEDGSLSNVQVTEREGDARLRQIAADFAKALSASHALSALNGAEHV